MDEGRFYPLAVGETLKDRQNAQERLHIKYVLALSGGNKSHAGSLLGISRQNLRERMKALGMADEKGSLR